MNSTREGRRWGVRAIFFQSQLRTIRSSVGTGKRERSPWAVPKCSHRRYERHEVRNSALIDLRLFAVRGRRVEVRHDEATYIKMRCERKRPCVDGASDRPHPVRATCIGERARLGCGVRRVIRGRRVPGRDSSQAADDHGRCRRPREEGVCVFLTLSHCFHPPTSSTPSVRVGHSS